MRYLIGERHRQIILEHLPRGGRMLEWGSGTSTTWFADRLPDGATLLSVEHDAAWHRKVCEMLPDRPRVDVRLRPATGQLGPNASSGEERPDLLGSYVAAADRDGPFDVILVDGVARGACLERARDLLKPGGVAFLHDAQRPWYDRAKSALAAWGSCGSCPDYPGAHLWWGGNAELEQPEREVGEMPLIVSYYTADTPYEDEARQLIETLDRLDLEHRVAGLEPSGSWIENCGRKARVIRDAWRETGRSVLWLDADARVYARPALLAGTDADFAIRCHLGWAFNCATVFFNRTPLAGELLADWVRRVELDPKTGEQIHLDLAWESLVRLSELGTLWLPPSYAMIFDDPTRGEIEPVIEQTQASRRLAPEQRTEDRVEVHHWDAREARLARRPREELVAHTWNEPDSAASPDQRVPSPDADLPEAVKAALADRLALELATTGFSRVAVFGAGRVARDVVGSALTRRGIEIACVLDDFTAGSECLGHIVASPGMAASNPRFDAVVVASDAWEDELFASATRWFCETGVPVLRVFGWRANPWRLLPAAAAVHAG